MKSLFLITSLLLSTQLFSEIIIFKQWHLSPKQTTTDINQSTKLPQYANQKSIYLQTKKFLAEGKSQVVLAEGCEGEIDSLFKENFNGWDFAKLNSLKDSPQFDDVLTLVPLKIEVFFKEKVLTLCADKNDLVKEHQLTLSDLRAYFGYITRLNQYKGKDEKSYRRYAESLNAPAGKDPLLFAKEKGKLALDKFKSLIRKRNDSFFELALKHQEKNPIIIIGGLHAEDLEKRFKEKKIEVKIIEDETYAKEEQGLFKQLQDALN